MWQKLACKILAFPMAVRDHSGNMTIDVKANNEASIPQTGHHHMALVVREFIKALADAGD